LAGFALLTLGSVYLAIRFKMNLLFGLPVAGVVVLQLIYNYKPLYYLLVAAIPISLQVELPGGSAMDMVSEPLMLLFLLIWIFDMAAGRHFSRQSRLYPFHILIALILVWTFISMVTSTYFFRSFKFFLSRLWYLAAFVFMAQRILSDEKSVHRLIWAFFIPLVLMTIFATVRHGLEGFSFESSNTVSAPFFANHVIYGAAVTLFVPLAWYLLGLFSPRTLNWYIVLIGLSLLLLAVALSYARGAWITCLLLPFVAIAVVKKWLEPGIYVGIFVVVLGLTYLINDNTYYQFAPEYKKTVFHEGDLEGHLSATFEGEEMSTMERFYRWIAAFRMVADRPILGFGPSTFNQNYKSFADDSFRTYVSDNPEQSTTHNYFLMTFAEQGMVGGLLFLGFCIYMMIKGARLYHRLENPQHKRLILAILMMESVIILHSALNELIEVDKVGAMFWLGWVILHKLEVWGEEE
jgi:O-antigen ligase